jgi:hypothetical protein
MGKPTAELCDSVRLREVADGRPTAPELERHVSQLDRVRFAGGGVPTELRMEQNEIQRELTRAPAGSESGLIEREATLVVRGGPSDRMLPGSSGAQRSVGLYLIPGEHRDSLDRYSPLIDDRSRNPREINRPRQSAREADACHRDAYARLDSRQGSHSVAA